MRTLILFLLIFSLVSCSEAPDLSPSEKQPVLLKRNYNDNFTYEILPAMGSGTLKQHGTTKDLLKNIPYLFSSGIIPPEFVVNEILSKGKVDAGMSGGATWEPYTLNTGNFDSLVKELESSPGAGALVYKQPDLWVKNYEDWNIWVMYIKHGIPWKEHKRLVDKIVILETQMEKAKSSDDEDKVYELHLKLTTLSEELSDFILRHRK